MADARETGNSVKAGLECDVELKEIASKRTLVDFEEIFRRYARPVLGFIYNLIGDLPRAEELVQETFIRAFNGVRSWQETSKISTWLFGIAHNVVRESIREKYRNERTVDIGGPDSRDVPDSRQRPDQHVISREMFKKIQWALASLPDDHRVVFVLKVVYRLQYEDIACITGASVGKLKTDLHRARMEMRRRLTPYFGERCSGLKGKP